MNLTNGWRFAVALVAALGGMTMSSHGDETQSAAMHEVAVTAERPAGAPEYADVCFRYGWVRVGDFPTVEDAKKAMRAFHATRADWFYPGSHTAEVDVTYVIPEAQDFIDWCHANGMKVGGTINTLTRNEAWKAGAKTNFGRFNGDPANPEYVEAAVAWGKAQIDAGVDTLVCDDLFGYKTEEEKQMFSANVIEAIKAYKAGFTIAGNHGGFIGTRYVKPYAFDFHYSDNNFIPDPSDWWEASKAHRAEKSAILLHPNRKQVSKEQRRTMIALGYASGAHVMAPWDEFLQGGERLFADPADFADLYGFARALGQEGFLNGYEDAAVGGYDLKETRYGAASPIEVSGGSGELSVFGRARPGQADAPVVMHLVEWGTAEAATLRLRIAALFGTSDVNCRLLAAPAYDEADHTAAQDSGDYAALARVSTITPRVEGDVLVFDVPPVTPWGVLIIAPAGDE